METDNNRTTAGVLYIDNIRLIYGLKNDDLIPPLVTEVYPAEGSTLAVYTNIRIQVRDDGTGIDPAAIRFLIDGQPRTDYIYNAAAGNVQWNTRGLSEGSHQFTLKLKDRFGNETVKNWVYIWVGK